MKTNAWIGVGVGGSAFDRARGHGAWRRCVTALAHFCVLVCVCNSVLHSPKIDLLNVVRGRFVNDIAFTTVLVHGSVCVLSVT
jgi:hypothetical protein